MGVPMPPHPLALAAGSAIAGAVLGLLRSRGSARASSARSQGDLRRLPRRVNPADDEEPRA